MSDSDLRELDRASKTGDPVARYRFRVECVRIGKPELAGFEAGDLARVRCEGQEWDGILEHRTDMSPTGEPETFLSARRLDKARVWCSPHGGHTGPRLNTWHWTLLEPARPA